MVTLQKKETSVLLSMNIRPQGFEGDFDPNELIVAVIGEQGSTLEHLRSIVDGEVLSVEVPHLSIKGLGLHRLVVRYSLRDADYPSGKRIYTISEYAIDVKRLERTPILGGGFVDIPTITEPVGVATVSTSTVTADINSLLNAEIDVEALGFAEGDVNRWMFRSGDDGGHAYTLGTVLKNIPNTSAGRAIAMANTASREAKQALASCRSIDTRVVGIEGTLNQLQQTNCSGCASLQESIERLSRRLIAVEERLNGSNAYVVPVSPIDTPTEVATPTVSGATSVDSFTRVGAEREPEGDEAATPVPDNHS